MAVSLPSDLVADVMRNADPARRSVAVARLQAPSKPETAFASALESVPSTRDHASTHVAAKGAGGAAETSSVRGFEQMVLRNLFESLLPKEESGSFGSGPAAGVWRSMAADQLAGVYAENGGIGIARLLASEGSASAPRRDAQWPYFSLNSLRAPGSAG